MIFPGLNIRFRVDPVSQSPTENAPQEQQAAAWFLVASAVVGSLACVLLWFSFLRENPQFWRNSGGYPIFLRDLVLVGFYPLLVVTVFGLAGLTAFCARIRMPSGFGCFESLVIFVCWGLVCGSLFVAFRNNVVNLWNDKPLHEKRNDG